MIESGQQFGLYVIKDVGELSDTQACCCAEDPFFNREVSLKIYFENSQLGAAQLEQFESLLETLSGLDHPSIAPIYDSGFEEQAFYYTSPCYTDGDLAQHFGVPLPAEQALKILVELSQALEFAFDRNLIHGPISAEKVYFDPEQRAVLFDFGIDFGLSQITASDRAPDSAARPEDLAAGVTATLRSLGELLLQMLLGPGYNNEERIDDQLAGIGNNDLRRLLGRFLLPGEWRFASFSELLQELSGFGEVASLLREPAPVAEASVSGPLLEDGNRQPDDQTEEVVAEVRRLVVEKNALQQALDKALYERNLAGNKQVEGQRQLEQASEAICRAKEEANVAWELVAGQRYDRWRPVAWAVGGFVIGFLLSGSYGYYYSEQTRDELMAKLKANEELIKTATWRPAEQPAQAPAPAPLVVTNPGEQEALPEPAPQVSETPQVNAAPVLPVAEQAEHWWPAGNEFSVSAAIPMAQIKAALGISAEDIQGDLSDVLRQEVVATVKHWADSWAEQDLSNYFSFYSEEYLPELGRSQQQWREMRRSRINRPEWIKLDLEDIQVRKVGENRIQVKLKQSYRSDVYRDEILKSINLIKEDGQWRILMERSLGMVASFDVVGG